MLYKNIEAISAQQQLAEFNEKRKPSQLGKLLTFKGVDGFDVYNTSIPFNIDGKTVDEYEKL